MNGIPKELLLSVGGALLCAFAVSFLMCPLVKSFAYKIGAIDVPKDNRRMHKKPVPRLGGLAIFLGFIVSMLLFVKVDHQLQGILLGASIIVVLGVVDDMSPLRAYFKFCVQIFAALVAVFHGVVIQTLSNPNVFAESPYWDLGWLSIPITVLWIVGITNAVNLIDGLDGLACGVSTISAISMLVIALLVSESDVALVMAALVGACLGFMPYNKNPRNVDKELALGGTDKRIRLLRAADGGDNALSRRVQPIDGEVLARGCAARGHAQNEVQPRRVVERAHRFAAVVIRDGNDVIEFHFSRPPTVR